MNAPVLPLLSPVDVREVSSCCLPENLPYHYTAEWVVFRSQGKVFMHVWTRKERIFVRHALKRAGLLPKKRKHPKHDS